MIYDVAIAGAGVIGGVLARELMRYKLTCCILEKENDVAMGASKANSGIIHGGFDPKPGTLKAELNAKGVPLLYKAAKELNVPHKNNGSIVLAFSKDEEELLKELYERGIENGIEELRLISGDEARAIEPNISKEATMALLSPTAGIICPYALTIAAVGNAMDNGAELLRNFEIVKIEKSESFTVIAKDGRKVEARYLINCAGTHSDKIAEMLNDNFFKIIPRAGEYILLDKTEGKTVSHTIFQVPTKNGKGVLVTPTADGNLLLGPTSLPVDEYDNTETTGEGLAMITRLAKKSVPTVNTRNVITSFAGVRASENNGDFIIEPSKKINGLLHIAAIDSPGLSSCVAIAEYAIELLHKMGLTDEKNPEFNPAREDTHAFKRMNDEEKNEYIIKHPTYGRIVCRCETVSEGEIIDAIHRNPPALDIDGIKRRTRSGMGRCQGGFCAPYVMRIIAEQTGMEIQKITKKGGRSAMLECEEAEQ